MSERFNELYENFFPTTMKTVKRVRYPKQIQFSEEFLTALNAEYARLQTVTEAEVEENTPQPAPIKNYRDKFLKALNFHVSAF